MKLLVDGGCDASLAGNVFIIESPSNRRVDVQDFVDSIKVERQLILSSITALDLEDDIVLPELSTCITVKNNQVSLLSII